MQTSHRDTKKRTEIKKFNLTLWIRRIIVFIIFTWYALPVGCFLIFVADYLILGDPEETRDALASITKTLFIIED